MTSPLPPSWARASLGSIFRVEYGKGLAKRQRVETGAVGVYGSAGLLGHHDRALIDEPVVIVGRKGNAGAVWHTSSPSWPIDTTYFLRVPRGMSADFLGLQLGHLDLVEQDSSTTIPSLRRPDLEAASVAVAPTPEQWRVVATIEEHFSRLDAAEAALRKNLERLDALRTSILADTFHTNRPLPPDWSQGTLGEIASWGSGGTPKRSESRYYGGHIPWAIIGDLNDGIILKCKEHITKEALNNSSCKLIEPGTVLIAMYGSIGKLGIAGTQMATNQAIAFADSYIDRLYLFYYLLSQRSALYLAGKGATQRNISQTVLKSWPIPVAPPVEQERIVNAIEEQLSRLDAAEAALCKNLDRIDALRKVILAEAFSGRLVPQDPNDEPASVLLERIAASRADSRMGRDRRIRQPPRAQLA